MSILYDKIDKPIVFFDIETTGIDIKNDRIIEICAIKYRPDRTKLTLHKYFNPGRESQPMALEAHGLTTEFLSKYNSFDKSALRFLLILLYFDQLPELAQVVQMSVVYNRHTLDFVVRYL